MVATKNSYKICELFTEMTVNELFDVNGGAARILDHGDVQEARPPKIKDEPVKTTVEQRDITKIHATGDLNIDLYPTGAIKSIHGNAEVDIYIDKSIITTTIYDKSSN